MLYLGVNKWFCRLFNGAGGNKFKTERGRTVEMVDYDSFIVQHRVFFWSYVDLKSVGFTWQKGSSYFRDCIGSKEKVEMLYGKILIPKEDED